jgi:hypothetical protein
MMSQDYALDVKRIRQNAIDTCVKIVLENPESEDLVGGWTLSCPAKADTLKAGPFEECVLLLTQKAMYLARFDWDAEKVGQFERVELVDIRELWRGAYVTSALGPTHLDEEKNVGFVVKYETHGGAIVRRNTRALSSEEGAGDDASGKEEGKKKEGDDGKKEGEEANKTESRLLAFKVLPPKSSAVRKDKEDEATTLTEKQLVERITDQIQKSVAIAMRREQGTDHLGLEEKIPTVEERDVISAAEARKSTGYLESLGYSLKRMVWS